MGTSINGGYRSWLQYSIGALRWLVSIVLCYSLGWSPVQSSGLVESGSLEGLGAGEVVTAPEWVLLSLDGPQDTAPPLPANCDGLALPGGAPPVACVYGYVYLDGVAVAGASVMLSGDTGYLSVTTQPGPASTAPYYAAALSETPLQAAIGAIIAANAVYSSRNNRSTFEVASAGQQVDIWLSTSCGPTMVGGVIASDRTWTRACGPYNVTDNLLVQDGVKLTIEAGTTILVQAGKALQVDGILDAQGQANAMIALTSAAQTPAAGDWGYLLLVDGVDHMPFDYLVYALIEYAGGAAVSDNGALRMNNAWPILQHLTVRHNASDGVHFYNNSISAIKKSNIHNNAGWGIYTYSDALSANNDTLYVHHNGAGGLYIRGKGPYWLYDSAITYNNGSGIYVRGSGGTLLDFYATRILVQGNRSNSNNGAGIFIYSGVRAASVSDSLILDNDAYGASSSGGGISCYSGCELYNNIIRGNHAASHGGGVYLYGNSTGIPYKVHHNIIVANRATRAGGGIWHGPYANADTTISNNTILWNQSVEDGGGLNVLSTLPVLGIPVLGNTILYNTSTDPTGGGVYVSKNPVLNANNLYANTPYDLANGNLEGTSDVNAEQNYWGTSDPSVIRAHIWDWLDENTLGLVDFEPFALAHILDAPISPPTGLTASAVVGTSVVLSWSASPEADHAGYKVYYDLDASGFPYDGLGANEGDSPIDVGAAMTYTLTGLPPGAYYVTVTAYDTTADGVRDQTDGNESWYALEQVVTISVPPTADFSAVPTSGIAPLLVNFTNLSTGDYDTCAWDFGDSGTSSQCANPSHTYASAGIYNVSLAVSGPAGMDTHLKSAYITAYTPAVADFSGTPTSGMPPLAVNFTNLSSGDYATCTWDFGDGGSSSQCANPSHTFQATGVYSVSLAVSGTGGTNTRLKNSYITVYGPAVADFSGTPTSGILPLQVNFTNLSTGTYATCAWDFGDSGTSSQCANPSHTYQSTGVYSVSLAVSGAGGSDTSLKNAYITVYAPAVADFSGTPTSGIAPLLVNFTNLSTGDYDTCAWDFGDSGTSSQCANPSHTFQASGVYSVSLAVSGTGGTNTRTRPNYISAGSVPVADFYGTPTRGNTPLSVQFTNQSTGAYDTCAWDFGDGSTSNGCVDPSHVYLSVGTYSVSLTISGAGGTGTRLRNHYITVTAAGDAWYSGGPFGGYVNSLAMAASNPDVIYAGTVEGVYKSTDGGAQWAKTSHPDIEVWSVAVAPNYPNIVYTGTADGLYKSTDSGATWQRKGLLENQVRAIAVDPRNAMTLFAGTTGGVYKSVDSGDTWIKKYALWVNLYEDIVNFLLVDSDDSRFVYAAISASSNDGGLLKSTDGGETWTSVQVNNDDENNENVFMLAMTPAGAGLRTLYALSEGLIETTDVYKSVDRGDSWTRCYMPENYFWLYAPVAVAVDPTDSNRVYLGVKMGESWGQVYKSTDAGTTWQLKMNGMPEDKPTSILVDPRNGHVLVGLQNGGIYQSTNAAENWSYSSIGLLNTDIVGMALHPTNSATGFVTIRGRGHHLVKTSDQGVSWTVMASIPSGNTPEIQAELGALAYDPQNPNTVYIGDGWQIVEDLYLYKSTNGGESWEELKFMDRDRFYSEEHGVADIWVHPNNSSILLVAVEGWGVNNAGGVYRSYNGGYAWTRSLSFWSTTLAADPDNPNIIYAGTRQCGYVYRSENGGIGWANISPSALPGECWVWSVNDLEVDSDGSLYAATSAGLMKWDGLAWTQLTGFPGLGTALAIDRTSVPSTLYIGTGYFGVYFSQDSGDTWTSLNEGLASLSINKLTLASSPNKILYAGTEYGGVWVRELSEIDSHKLFLPLIRR